MGIFHCFHCSLCRPQTVSKTQVNQPNALCYNVGECVQIYRFPLGMYCDNCHKPPIFSTNSFQDNQYHLGCCKKCNVENLFLNYSCFQCMFYSLMSVSLIHINVGEIHPNRLNNLVDNDHQSMNEIKIIIDIKIYNKNFLFTTFK